jgi:hypothetical protein
LRLKKCPKTIFDPSDWDDLEKSIKGHMEAKFKNLHVDYVVIFVKTRRHGNNDQTEVEENLNDYEDAPTRKKQKSNVVPHFLLLILAIGNRQIGRRG